jgi:hypothetical protein
VPASGIWFAEQSVDCLADAIEHFERHAGEFAPQAVRQQALRFHQRHFGEQFDAYIKQVLGQPQKDELRRAA